MESDKGMLMSLLQGELVALASTFGDGQSIIRMIANGNTYKDIDDIVSSPHIEILSLPWTIEVRIDPSMCGDVTSYVQFTLILGIGRDYPDMPDMHVSIEQPKGLDCETEGHIRDGMVRYLDEEVLDGEMHGCGACIVPMIFHAVELAQEYNRPHGKCVFCLEDLENTEQDAITKVEPCFHCFCTTCYQAWFIWKQRMIQLRVKELHEEHNNNTMIISKAMEDEGIVEVGDIPGQYMVSCPCCRGPVQLQEQITQEETSTIKEQDSKDMIQSVKDLPIALRESVARLQEQFSKLMTIQREHNGLIEKQPS